ncbi:MAG TPA: hypothetical protein VNM39_13165 [Verrucomicrobiae bacterium]|nr:hypothetical protein [Verrucomicrobiae bacterium]
MRPRIEQTPDGRLWLVIPFPGGAREPSRHDAMRVELSPDGLAGLASDIAERFESLKQNPDQMKRLGTAFVSGLVDVLTKGRG